MFNIIIKSRMFGPSIVPKKTGFCRLNLFSLRIFLTKVLEMGCLGWDGMSPKEIFSCLFSSVNLNILDMDLEIWFWWPLITDMCGKSSSSRRSGYMGLRKNMQFKTFWVFLTFSVCFLLLLSYSYFYEFISYHQNYCYCLN